MKIVLFVAGLVALLPWLAAVAAAPIDVTLFSDANGDVASISLFGKANCASSGQITSPCLAASAANDANAPCSHAMEFGCGIAISGTGNTLGWTSVSGTGTAAGSYAVSGANQCSASHHPAAWSSECFAIATSGDAKGFWFSVAPAGSASGGTLSIGESGSAGWVAVSPNGPSNGGYAAVSGTGPSSGPHAVSVMGDSYSPCGTELLGTCYGGAAVSVFGDSSCESPWLTATSCIALTADGDADGVIPFSVFGTCNAVQCFAIAPVGDAEGYWLAVAGTGSATAEWIAISVFGDANAQVGATLRDALCHPDAICVRP